MTYTSGLVEGERGPLELLVLQPTPFCNINCSYCYLPDRQATDRMSPETLEAAYRWVFASGLVRQPFTVLWHAGEPLVVPIAFYEEAIERLARHNVENWSITHSFQTNATLLTPAWCEFIRQRNIHVGVSVDGPAYLHDRCRKTRQGQGTHARVLRGLQLLREYEIPVDVISVLTAESLNSPDELFDFYLEQGVKSVGFNVEEIEGPNTTSSLLGTDIASRFRRFFARFLDLAASVNPPLPVREFDTAIGSIHHVRYGPGSRIQENQPFAILNVDWAGNFCTYSPELLGLSSERYGDFALGNVHTDTLPGVLASERFRRQDADIAAGVALCREQCRYYTYCGGGPPGNKYFENGTFASTETLSCRLHKQATLDVTLTWLEQHRQPAEATS